jgi:hypothetical protein
MQRHITTTLEDGFLRVTGRGLASELAVGLMEQAVIASLANNVTRILFDLREIELDESFMGIFNHGQRAKQMGLSKPYRLAALNSQLCDKMRFMDLTGRTLGFDSRIFADEREAIAWLKEKPA